MAEKTITFGIPSLGKPTPMAFRYAFRVVLYLSGLWALLSPSMTNMSEETLNEINKWLLIGNTGMNFTIKFFGWDFSDKPDTDNP